MMAPQERALPSELFEKIGSLTASAERADQDRSELKTSIDGLAKNVHALELAFNAMTQTMASTSTLVASIAAKDVDGRVKELERKQAHYDKVIGTAGRFAWRLVVALATAAVAGGVGTKILSAMHIL